MAKTADRLTELIGNTPLLALRKFSAGKGLETPILAKIEYFNPGGSVKDRIALAMIEDAEAKGQLKPGATIIEPTSGNTGVGLALVAAVKGYRLILTMPETMSVERRNLVKAYGATVKLTSGKDGMKGAIKAAEELRSSIPGSVILQQFENQANPALPHDRAGDMAGYRRQGGCLRSRRGDRRHRQRHRTLPPGTESGCQDRCRRAGRIARPERREERTAQDTGHRGRLRTGDLQQGIRR